MAFSLSLASRTDLHPRSTFVRSLKFADPDEENYARQSLGYALNNNARVHILWNDRIPYGFSSLSLGILNEVPAVYLEYLFTSLPYRRATIADLGDVPHRVSEFLLGQSIKIVEEATARVPIRYMALQAKEVHLASMYSRAGFKPFGSDGWMSLKLQQP